LIGPTKNLPIAALIKASNLFIVRLYDYVQRIRVLFYTIGILTICLFIFTKASFGSAGIIFLIAHYIYLNKLKKELSMELAIKNILKEIQISEMTGVYPDHLK